MNKTDLTIDEVLIRLADHLDLRCKDSRHGQTTRSTMCHDCWRWHADPPGHVVTLASLLVAMSDYSLSHGGLARDWHFTFHADASTPPFGSYGETLFVLAARAALAALEAA